MNARQAAEQLLAMAERSGHGPPDLALIHAGLGHDLPSLSRALQLECPGIRVMATSCAGVIGTDGPGETLHDIALMGVHGKDFTIAHVDGLQGCNAFAKGVELALGLQAAPLPVRMLLLMACGSDLANDRLIDGLESVLGPEVVIFGASSTDPRGGSATFQMVDDHLGQQTACAMALWDPGVAVVTGASHGFVAVDAPMRVTRAVGNRIDALDDGPAWPRYLERLGLTPVAGVADTLSTGALATPLSAADADDYGNPHLLRAVVDHRPDGAMVSTTTFQDGDLLWLTIRDEDLIFEALDQLLDRLKAALAGRRALAVFHADCLVRGRWLLDRVSKEELVHRIQQCFACGGMIPPWLGIYGAGEFARLGDRNRFHNYTTALAVLCASPGLSGG